MLAEGHLSPARVQSFDEQGLSSWEGSQPPADGTEPVPKVLTGASGTKMLLFILNVAAFRGLPRTPPPNLIRTTGPRGVQRWEQGEPQCRGPD